MARQAGLSLTEQEQWINEIVKIVTDSRLMEVITSGESPYPTFGYILKVKLVNIIILARCYYI